MRGFVAHCGFNDRLWARESPLLLGSVFFSYWGVLFLSERMLGMRIVDVIVEDLYILKLILTNLRLDCNDFLSSKIYCIFKSLDVSYRWWITIHANTGH